VSKVVNGVFNMTFHLFDCGGHHYKRPSANIQKNINSIDLRTAASKLNSGIERVEVVYTYSDKDHIAYANHEQLIYGLEVTDTDGRAHSIILFTYFKRTFESFEAANLSVFDETPAVRSRVLGIHS